jgi:Family of unknown function (DUF6445)
MEVRLNPDARFRRLSIGRENAPMLVIDEFVSDADALIEHAAHKWFTDSSEYFPGIRARAPLAYRNLLLQELGPTLIEFFGLEGKQLEMSMCRYSLVTTPPEKLTLMQRVPHFDAPTGNRLATVHYLFRGNLGGTAFYRHRKTGFEYIDDSRKLEYARSLVQENDGPNMPGPEYINGDTALFEQIDRQDGIFNRMIVYRGNSLHSGCIDRKFVPDPNPLTGRLSINCFLDAV